MTSKAGRDASLACECGNIAIIVSGTAECAGVCRVDIESIYAGETLEIG